MKVEVLVATMHQSDLNKYHEMNLNTDAVFANQSDKEAYYSESFDNHTIKMITTKQRGVGKNRNIGLLYMEGDICALADDDMQYIEGYEEIILKAYRELPDADIILFNISDRKKINEARKITKKIKRVHFYNIMNYGAPRITFRSASLKKANVWFSVLYGGGAKFSAGEDSLFLMECLKKGLKIYTYPAEIAVLEETESTWFSGYTEKYFYDKGYLYANLPQRFAFVLAIQDVIRHQKKYRNSGKIYTVFKIILKGISDFMNEKVF